MDSDGGNHVRLTIDPAIDYDPSWSPNGDRIAFVSNRDNGVEQIYVMDSDGRNLMRLTKESTHNEPAWSPAGEKIVYVRNKGGYQVWVMDADGQNQTRLTHVGLNVYSAWSPDGKRIAFASFRGGVPEIYVMDENGNNQERLTQHMAITGHPSWSPDGRWIAYSSLDVEKVFQIYLVRADGVPQKNRLTRKLPHKYHPAWSPGGDAIAYTSEDPPFIRTTIHLMTAKGVYLKQLGEVADGSDSGPDWVDPTAWSVYPATSLVTIWGGIKKLTSGL